MTSATLITATLFYLLVVFFVASVILIYQKPKRWHMLLTLFVGLSIAFIDVQSSEVSFTILLLLAFGFFLGFTQSAKPLRTALLLAIWVPVAGFIHLGVPYQVSGYFTREIGSLISFISAIAGSYLGAFIRKGSEARVHAEDLPH